MPNPKVHDPRSNIRVLVGFFRTEIFCTTDSSPILQTQYSCTKKSIPKVDKYNLILFGKEQCPFSLLSEKGVFSRVFTKILGVTFFNHLDREYYALLPSGRSPRIAVSLKSSNLYKNGLLTYRPGNKFKQYLLNIGRWVGRFGFMGQVLEIGGPGVKNTLARKISQLCDPLAQTAAVFYGSPGSTNTTTLKIVAPKKTYFAKVSTGSNSNKFVTSEANCLIELNDNPLRYAKVPSVLALHTLEEFQVLILEDAVSVRAKQSEYCVSNVMDLMVELNERTRIYGSITESSLGNRIKERINNINIDPLLHDAWKWICISLRDIQLPLGMAHGDFVPWNILQDRESTVVIDWEWSSKNIPPAIDLAHYMCQSMKNLDHEVDCIWAEDGFISSYLVKLKVDKNYTAPLVAAYLVDWILFELVEGEKNISNVSFHMDMLQQLLEENKQ